MVMDPVSLIQRAARKIDLRTSAAGFLKDQIAEKQIVLLGESTHGTREFYEMRTDITQMLVREFDFRVIAIEGDWPDVYRINSYVQGWLNLDGPDQALSEFSRFPKWMWRNREFLGLIAWLREFNKTRPPQDRVGVYGLDLYNLNASIAHVLAYLEDTDPKAARRARERYECFSTFIQEPQRYGYETEMGMTASCRDAVIAQLREMASRAHQQLTYSERDAQFAAEQSARLAVNAETYYRSLFSSRENSWNVRDRHMFETLQNVAQFRANNMGKPAKCIVWAHNSHIGDASSTEMSRRGEINLGQLVKETYGAQAYSLGFTTYEGTVIAASGWDKEMQIMTLQPALPDSVEYLFHQCQSSAYFLSMSDELVRDILTAPRLERAVGVVYFPQAERWSHYFVAQVSSQFDGIVHIDRTTHLAPLDFFAHGKDEKEEDLYPSGL